MFALTSNLDFEAELKFIELTFFTGIWLIDTVNDPLFLSVSQKVLFNKVGNGRPQVGHIWGRFSSPRPENSLRLFNLMTCRKCSINDNYLWMWLLQWRAKAKWKKNEKLHYFPASRRPFFFAKFCQHKKFQKSKQIFVPREKCSTFRQTKVYSRDQYIKGEMNTRRT